MAGYGTAGRNAQRTGDGGGFKEFDEREDSRRKARAAEERQAKELMKATKTKCPFCKRAACLC